MKQKIVIRVDMNGQKSRSKALKIAVGVSGVESAAVAGKEKNQIEVVGDNIDAVELTTLLRKNVGHADLVSVTPVKAGDEKKEEAKKDVAPVPIPVGGYYYPYGYGPGGPGQIVYEVRDSNHDQCSIM